MRDAPADLVLLSVEVMSSGNDGESGEGTRAGVTHVSFVASEATTNGERINAQVRASSASPQTPSSPVH